MSLHLLLEKRINGEILSCLIEHQKFPQLLDSMKAYFTTSNIRNKEIANAMIKLVAMDVNDAVEEYTQLEIDGEHMRNELGAWKLLINRGDIEVVKNLFVAIVKDIKGTFEKPCGSKEIQNFKEALEQHRKQAAENGISVVNFDVEHMANTLLGEMTQIGFDEYEIGLLTEIWKHMYMRRNSGNIDSII